MNIQNQVFLAFAPQNTYLGAMTRAFAAYGLAAAPYYAL